MEIHYHKDNAAGSPEEEMAENVHHGIECDGRNGAGGTDVFGKFHHTIRTSTEAEGGDVTETEATDGQFQGIPEYKMLIMVGSVDKHLEGFGVKQVYKEPYTHHSRQIKYDIQTVLLYSLPAIREG